MRYVTTTGQDLGPSPHGQEEEGDLVWHWAQAYVLVRRIGQTVLLRAVEVCHYCDGQLEARPHQGGCVC